LNPSQTILKVFSDKKAIILLNAIAKGRYYEGSDLEVHNLIDRRVTCPIKNKTINLSSAKFRSSLIRLTEIGIFEKKEGRFVLTQPGKIVYQYQKLIGAGLDNYWKLKVLDSLGIYDTDRVSSEVRAEIIDSLIGSPEIKDILKF
jgi:hypothetical protein